MKARLGKASPRAARTRARPIRRRPSKTRESVAVTAEPKTAETTGANECWAARATWLEDTPDRPALYAGARWERLITNGRSVSGDHGSLAKAVRVELARVAASHPAARPVKLVQAAFVRPPFFRDRAGILLVHASGQGMRSDRRRYDAILFAVKHAASGKSWKVTSYNFKSAALHQLNLEAPLVAERHALAYMRYFMHVVRGPEGPFRLVDEPEPNWPFSPKKLQLSKDRAKRAGARVEESLHIPKFDGIDYAGRLRYQVCILYAGHFFAADVAIHHGGLVEMVSDRPIAEVPQLKE